MVNSYSWSQIGGQHVTLNATNTDKTSFIAPSNISSVSNVLVIQLKVTDNKNATDISTTKITVKPVDHVPVADAGINQTVNAGEIATLDGSESNDPDGDLLIFRGKEEARNRRYMTVKSVLIVANS